MRKPGRKGRNERKYQILKYARERGEKGFRAKTLVLRFDIKYNNARVKLSKFAEWGYLRHPQRGLYKISKRGLEWLDWYESKFKSKTLI